jgi:hypothetical protein
VEIQQHVGAALNDPSGDDSDEAAFKAAAIGQAVVLTACDTAAASRKPEPAALPPLLCC